MYMKTKSIKILAIGNSFSDNAMAYLYPICKAMGYDEIVLGNMYIGGCSLATHAYNAQNSLPAYTYRKNTSGKFVNVENVDLYTAIADEDWQYVTLQQASGVSGMEETYNADIETLKEYIYSIADKSQCKLLWHMTWAYQQDSVHPEFTNYGNSQSKMYHDIVQCVLNKIATDNDFTGVIPSGTAIQNARTSFLGDTLTADGYHLDELGEFIVGLTWAAAVTKRSLKELDANALPQQFVRYLDVATGAVEHALANPFEITQSKYTTDPDTSAKIFDFATRTDVSYSNCSAACRLDAYLPCDCQNFDTIVHFHGGGLTSGDKSDATPIAREIASRGVAFVSANYRLYPEARTDEFYVDATSALRYVFDNIKALGGNGNIYVSGQSAGANIAMMLAFNKKHLERVNLAPTDVAGWIVESGQPTVHFETLRQSGQDSNLQIIDERAPIYHVNSDTQVNKMFLIAYTDDIENRLSQNEKLYTQLHQKCASSDVKLRILYGKHCASSTTPCRGKYAYTTVLLNFVKSEST